MILDDKKFAKFHESEPWQDFHITRSSTDLSRIMLLSD